MREMKDSGFDWLKEIPKDWKLIRIKNLIANVYNVKKKFKEVDVLSLGVNGVVIKENLNFGMNPTNYDDHNIVKKGQYVICLRDLDGPLLCGISKYEGCLSALYYIFDFNKHVNKYFFNYIMKTTDYTRFIDAFSYGMRHSYNFLQFGNLKIPFPDLIEQKLIVDFLDIKCAEIDGITKDLQEQIETLENYKKSVITEAVTKGLNPSVDYNDNKKQWFRGIPKHWIVSRIAAIYKLRNTKVSDRDYPPLSVTMQGVVPQLENAAKSDAHDDRKLVCKGDFAINSRSDRRGSCGIAPMDGSISLINTVLCPLTNMNARYYNWLFHTVEFADEFYKWGHGIVNDLWTTNWQDMKNILIPRPPIQEQKEIANYLDTKCAEIDEIIKNKKEQLETIEEYKKSLIYEYVTGKKEVKNA